MIWPTRFQHKLTEIDIFRYKEKLTGSGGKFVTILRPNPGNTEIIIVREPPLHYAYAYAYTYNIGFPDKYFRNKRIFYFARKFDFTIQAGGFAAL
tara:strand:+ start:577 stop:861 length:285 start_codon:yes stop_codon:yes gene_type:complete